MGTVSLVETLDRIVAETVSTLIEDPLYGPIYDGTVSREVYLRFLRRTHQYVLYTTTQLDEAARVLKDSPDPVHKAFVAKLSHHSREETGHDRWLRDDIVALGGDAHALESEEPCLAVAAYIAMLGVVLKSENALGVLGVGYYLEAISEKIGPRMAENLKRNSHIPNIANAVSFIEAHGIADVKHMAETRAALGGITNEGDKAAIVLLARLTAAEYQSLLSP
jgi:pyrroloquinoline quinone (PQQ) biosynthesis protein C